MIFEHSSPSISRTHRYSNSRNPFERGMSRNEIEQIVTNLNLSNPFVVTKSMEIERIMRLKVPQGSLKKVYYEL